MSDSDTLTAWATGLVSLVWLVALWTILSGLSILAFASRLRGATAPLRA